MEALQIIQKLTFAWLQNHFRLRLLLRQDDHPSPYKHDWHRTTLEIPH